jgi:hypothetical protein
LTFILNKLQGSTRVVKKQVGEKSVIQRALIQELLKLKPVYNNRDLDGLRKLYDACETHYRPLEAQGVNVSTYSSVVVPTIMEKLPEMFRLTITREREFLEWSMKLLARQQQDSAKFIPRCAYCLQEHDPNNCTKVKRIIECKQLMRKYGRCFICLKRDI